MIVSAYDLEADVIYLSKGSPVPNYAEESEDGMLYLYSYDKNMPCGVTILYYMAYWAERIDSWVGNVSVFLDCSVDEIRTAIDNAMSPKVSFG